MTTEQMIDQIVQKRKEQLDQGCFGKHSASNILVRLNIYRDGLERLTHSELKDWYLKEGLKRI